MMWRYFYGSPTYIQRCPPGQAGKTALNDERFFSDVHTLTHTPNRVVLCTCMYPLTYGCVVCVCVWRGG